VTRRADLTVASYNIHKGVGTDRKRDLARTAAVIAEIGADILALQEADTRFGTRTGLLDLESLRREVGLIPVPVEGAGMAHGWHGNLILVRNALVEVVHKIALPGLEPRGALIADLVAEGRPVRVIAAHLGLLPASRTAQARTLLGRLDELDRRPTVLMGDMNEWRQTVASLGPLTRVFSPAPPVRSFPARYPVLPLDRMMAGHEAELEDLVAHDTPLARQASDHLPIKARLRL
jgi:endonuclease/exonuclease/phosphatase family metal-dependent hydrolase